MIVKFNSEDLDDSLAVFQMKDDDSLVQYLRRTWSPKFTLSSQYRSAIGDDGKSRG